MNTTPITFLSEGNNRIYLKRDDLIPFSFGGNKARKAVNFFKDIDDGHFDCVVTYGSGSSNHCRVVSNMSSARGIPCSIISPKEASESTFNKKMMELFGAEITVVPVDNVHDAIENKLNELRAEGRKPYFIPGGGHGNLGTQAYVECYEEIVSYEQTEGVYFDYIFFASGTGTTQAGLICGQLLNQDERKIIGISIAREKTKGRQIILDSVCDFLKEKQETVLLEKINQATVFIDDYIDSGYGKSEEKVNDTIRWMLTAYGIPLDSTYTGKAFTGMLDYIEKRKIQNKNILFIHTGGTPLFFNDLEKM